MVSDYKEILSESAKGMKRSAIRELLKLTQKPEIISFAGGLPAKESFPLEQLQEICAEVIATDGAAACQYGSTEGVPELLEILAQRYRDQGLSYVTKDNITIITSSQQGLDTVGKIFLNRGDKYICRVTLLSWCPRSIQLLRWRGRWYSTGRARYECRRTGKNFS